MKVLGLCGSLQARSANLTLLRQAAERMPSGAQLALFDGIRELPLFDPDLEGDGQPTPAPVTRFREALQASDAVLIASPEYGHGVPGALKNALDWVIGSGELYRKRVAVTASAPGPGRGQQGLDALCATLKAVDAHILGGEPIERGDPDADELLDVLLQALVEVDAA